MIHLPAESILADIKTNLAGGIRCQAILSEDLFRYGASGVTPAPEALIALLRQIRDIDGIGLIQSDHANIISIAQYSDNQLQTVRKLLVGDTGCDFPWVNVGVETASEALMRTNGCAPKMGSLAGNWPNACREQVHRLAEAGFFSLVSLMIGLPGETPDDIRQTLEWVQSLGDARLAIFPMLHAPIDTANTPAVRDLSKLHWKLVRQCYRFNFKWMPRMYWDNQKAAGVGLPKRLFMQCLGTGQILQWRALFAWHNMRASE